MPDDGDAQRLLEDAASVLVGVRGESGAGARQPSTRPRGKSPPLPTVAMSLRRGLMMREMSGLPIPASRLPSRAPIGRRRRPSGGGDSGEGGIAPSPFGLRIGARRSRERGAIRRLRRIRRGIVRR